MQSTTYDLKIGCWNSRGLSASVPFLRKILTDNDIFMVSEHWLHSNRLHMLGDISLDFDYHAKASKNSSEEVYGIKRGQGGVAIFWHKKLKGVSIIETLKHDRICGIRMEGPNGSVFVFLSVYLPASGSRESLAITLDELSSYIEGLDDNVIPIVAGDFNGDIGRQGGPRGIGRATKAGITVLNFIEEQNFAATNLLSMATGAIRTYEGHIGTSTIDYILIPSYLTDRIVSCHTGSNAALNTSDHLPIELVLQLQLLPKAVQTELKIQRLRWDKLVSNREGNGYQRAVDEGILPLLQDFRDNREVGLSRSRHRDRVSISPSMPFPISMLEHRIQGWAMPSR